MKNTSKILALVLVVMTVLMSLSALTVSAADAETRTIYLNAGGTGLWDQANAWFDAWVWGDSSSGAWYTFEDTDDDGVYEIQIPADSTGMIVHRKNPSSKEHNHNNSWNKTGDITISSTYNLITITGWDSTSYKWGSYTPPTPCDHSYDSTGKCTLCGGGHTYTVAGVPEFCGSEWSVDDTSNDMTYADGVYTKVYTNVAADTYSIKCAQDHAWTVAIGGSGDTADANGNYQFTVAKDGSTVTIILKDGVVSHEIVEPECDHDYVKTSTATCVAAGTATYTCSKCNDSYTKDEAALGHHYGSDGKCERCDATTTFVTITVTADGWTELNCYAWDSTNNNSPYVAWPGEAMTQNEDGTWTYNIPGECTHFIINGSKGQTGDVEVPANGSTVTLGAAGTDGNYAVTIVEPHVHSWADATCTEPQKCECGETQGEALGHTYVYGMCTCGSFKYNVGTNTVNVTEDYAMDALGGYYEFVYVYIPAAGHYTFNGGYTILTTLFTQAVDASFQTDNSKYVQNDLTQYQTTVNAWLEPGVYMLGLNFYGGATEYTYTIGTADCVTTSVVTAPTCENEGYTTTTCSLCGHVVVSDKKDALNHDWAAATCDEPKYCKRDGCDATEGEKLGHNFGEDGLAESCNREGCDALNPDVCQHESYTTVTVPATCGKDGKTYDKCDACPHTKNETVLPATGEHSWNDGEITTNPGCLTAGVKTFTCTVCNATKTEEVAATGHAYAYGFCQNPDCPEVVRFFQIGENKYEVTSQLMGTYEFFKIEITEAGWYQISANNPLLITCIFLDEIYAEDSDFTAGTGTSWDGPEDYASIAYLEEGTYFVGLYYTVLEAAGPGEYTISIDVHEHSYTEGECVCGEEDPDYVPDGNEPGTDEPGTSEPVEPTPEPGLWDKIVAFIKKILAMILGFFKK